LLIASIILFFGALTLVVMGYRTLAGWAVLASTFVTMILAIVLWRSSVNRPPLARQSSD
jgi:hypothetical protein